MVNMASDFDHGRVHPRKTIIMENKDNSTEHIGPTLATVIDCIADQYHMDSGLGHMIFEVDCYPGTDFQLDWRLKPH